MREFHEAFGLAVRNRPTSLIPVAERELRHALHLEELDELHRAIDAGDLVEIADGIADLIYVLAGTALHYGIDLDAVFVEVHRSNMSKLGPDGRPVRRADGKVLKGPDFFRPDIARALHLRRDAA